MSGLCHQICHNERKFNIFFDRACKVCMWKISLDWIVELVFYREEVGLNFLIFSPLLMFFFTFQLFFLYSPQCFAASARLPPWASSLHCSTTLCMFTQQLLCPHVHTGSLAQGSPPPGLLSTQKNQSAWASSLWFSAPSAVPFFSCSSNLFTDPLPFVPCSLIFLKSLPL